ncbi:antirepressor [Galliscardovia ingluviei]|uniref:Antirepressor n=1 Tax=Galliscardovia ingluviei TaxID=1769422 RepID=A0A8J3F3A4_9BIFI|nr:phage antirepressor [Galliscardovia ingluviei]GGI15396.1 antirepressor [Galliscardovia ingluviei]
MNNKQGQTMRNMNDNNQLQQFTFNDSEVRIITDSKNDPWFVAKDVCIILGHTNPSVALAQLDEDEITKIDPKQFLGSENRSNQAVNIISEAGLYKLIMRSRKENAKPFQRWVAHEVLPSIRKHGAYATPETIENIINDPEFGIRLLTELKNEKDKRIEAERKQAAAETHAKMLEPKARFADAYSASSKCILVGELAKILTQNGYTTGQQRLFQQLKQEGYLMKRNGNPHFPTQKSMNLGLFEIKTTIITHSNGEEHPSFTTKVTPKGQAYFINKYLHSKPAALRA